jgi:hypothetical protein
METEEPRMFANVGWCYEDCFFHNDKISKEDAEKFLEKWEDHIRRRITEYGMDLLGNLLNSEGLQDFED